MGALTTATSESLISNTHDFWLEMSRLVFSESISQIKDIGLDVAMIKSSRQLLIDVSQKIENKLESSRKTEKIIR